MVPQFVRWYFGTETMAPKELRQEPTPPASQLYRRDIAVAWPSTAESILIAAVSAVDTMMVGGLGAAAISAVGICSQPRLLTLAVIISLNVGVTAIVARRRGENNTAGAVRCFKQSLLVSAILTFLVCGLSFFFARPLLLLSGADPEYLELSVQYFRIIDIGLLFYAVTLTINAAQRGAGNTKIALRTNLTANVINLIFNYFLINGYGGFPRLEVAGAALATTLGNIVAFFMALASVLDRRCFISLRNRISWRFEKTVIASIAKVSSSALAEQFFLRLGMLSFTRLVSGLGTVPYATHVVCMNIMNMSFSLGDGLGVAASALVGQSLGAKRPDLAMIYGKVTQRVAFLCALVMASIFFVGRFEIIRLFIEETPVIALGGQVMLVIAVLCLIQTTQVVLAGSLRGAGDTAFVALLALLGLTIVRPVVGWLLCYPAGLGLIGAWLGLLSDQFLRMLLLFRRFRGGRWTKIEL